MKNSIIRFGVFISVLLWFGQVGASEFPVQLASVYSDDVDLANYLVSEKYDGVRAIWKNGTLTTRSGKPIAAPVWFTQNLPDVWLDGELWSQRQDFEFISSTVSKNVPVDDDWRKIHYMIFDAPDFINPFSIRQQHYTAIVNSVASPYLQAIKQFPVSSNAVLSNLLDEYLKAGAEGLILHRSSAMFQSGRSDNVLKLKPYMDAEAEVIEQLPGKGKYTGQLGALLVQTVSGIRFKVGTGFTDAQRLSPPQIGDIITFKYHGVTKNGVPRFASFLRVRRASGVSE